MLDLSFFAGPPQFEPYIRAGRLVPGEFRMTADWWYDDVEHGHLWVLKDFITNFGSTPQLLRALPAFDPLQHCLYAALPHDMLFCFGLGTLSEANAVFLRAARYSEPSAAIPRAWYAGLCLGSWLPWRRYRKRGEGPQAEDFATLEGYARGWDYYQAVKAGRTWSP